METIARSPGPARPRRDHRRSAPLDGPPNYPLGIAAAEQLRREQEPADMREAPGDIKSLEDYCRQRPILGIDAEPQRARENTGQDQPTECGPQFAPGVQSRLPPCGQQPQNAKD